MSNWFIYNKKKNVKKLVDEFNISPLTSIILCNRDIVESEDVKMMLSNDLNDLNDEKLLPDIDKAVSIVFDYIKNKKNIRIVGDYDIDGIASTYILYDALKNLGANISYDIPNRIQDGYGINISIIDRAIRDKIDLIITCDNGIAAKNEIVYAKENGIECIVTDHHDVLEVPPALAVIDPKRTDVNTYPFSNICGAVVAWKFIMRLYDMLDGSGIKLDNKKYNKKYIIDKYLDFATIATIGDIMPLTNENHIIAKVGLKNIINTKNRGLKKLFEVSGLIKDDDTMSINVYHIGFIIGPLINACGRMDDATLALKLFLNDDENELLALSSKIKKLNDDRKNMTEEGFKFAIKSIEDNYKNDKVLVVFVENLGEQVAGIVAGRIKEKYNKPTIILTHSNEGGVAKASCRSIDAYDIFFALSKHKDMYIKFGGHKLAAGFSIKMEYIKTLRELLNSETELNENDFIKKMSIDAVIPINELCENMIKDIDVLEPYGQDFKKPQFADKNIETIIKNVYGASNNVLKLNFIKNNKNYYGVLFDDYDVLNEKLTKNKNLDIIYYPKINEFRGYRNIEINVVDYK